SHGMDQRVSPPSLTPRWASSPSPSATNTRIRPYAPNQHFQHDSTWSVAPYLPLGFVSYFQIFSVNVADNIPKEDDKQVPLQFVFESANCRIFYTPHTFADPANLRATVRDVALGDRTCTWGGMDTEVGEVESWEEERRAGVEFMV